jgi:hypothetical protein
MEDATPVRRSSGGTGVAPPRPPPKEALMTDHRDRNESNEGEESTSSGSFGERNRNTPGRTPRELGLDPEEMRGHAIVGESPGERTGDVGEYKGTSRFDLDRSTDDPGR